MSSDQAFLFVDFDGATREERQKIEGVLWSSSSRVEFPWNRHEDVVSSAVNSMVPCMTLPLHHVPAPMPMYAGPSMVHVYQYPPGMYPYMVPVPATMSSNGPLVPSSYIPVTMATGPNPIYASQPLMMAQVDGQRPVGVTVNCCPPSMAALHMMQRQMAPAAVAPAGQPGASRLTAAPTGSPEATAEGERRDRKIPPGANDYYPNRVAEPCKNTDEIRKAGNAAVPPPPLHKNGSETGFANRGQGGIKTIGREAADAVACQTNAEAVQRQIEDAISEAYPAGEDVSKDRSDHALSPNSWISPPIAGSRKSSTVSDAPARVAGSRKSSTASDTQAALAGNGGSSNTSTRRSSVASETSVPVSANGSQSGKTSVVTAPESKPKSWASLLHNTPAAANAIVVNASDPSQQPNDAKKTAEQKAPPVVKDGRHVDAKIMAPLDEVKAELMTLLKSHKLSHRSVYLQPRGLANRSNWCYVNATLQALLACPPFYHLIRKLSTINPKFWEVSNFPAMKCMVQFFNEFPVVTVKALDKQAVNAKGNVKADIRCGAAFEPTYVHKMLQDIDYEAFKLNQQEDAEEFLSCILNRLHDEMVNAMKQLEGVEGKKGSGERASLTNGTQAGKTDEGDDDTRWEQVRARNRTVYSSSGSDEASPVSSIFRGQICCILHQLGQKESATLQPFFTLQLDVQNEKVKSVQDALEQLVLKESLSGYTKSNVEVDATQRTLVEELPPVLVLHLKWFHYDKNGGIQKRIKHVDFEIDLEISRDFLSPHAKARTQPVQRKYKLFAVVNHIGARAIGGHYTVDVFHPGYNCWLRCDDNNIASVATNLVTKFAAPKVPYLIFYRRFELC